jgi:hypothetical protein
VKRTRSVHRILGLLLLLPIVSWTITGFVFFLKPGYSAAYRELRPREYPLEALSLPSPPPSWREVRVVRTILGTSLLVRTNEGWSHLDPATLAPRPLPDADGLRRLVSDATAPDTARYGEIASITRFEGDPPSATVETTRGVQIDLDWSSLALRQSGRDTRLIDGLYRAHYLQWSGVRSVDRVLGAVGLVCLFALAILGFRLAFGRRSV